MPHPSQLARMREVAALPDNLPDRCTVYAPPDPAEADKGEDAVALFPDAWVTLGSGLPCRLALMRGRSSEQIAGPGIRAKGEFNLLLGYAASANLAITEKCVVRITAQGGVPVTRDFQIRGMPDHSNRTVKLLEVDEIK